MKKKLTNYIHTHFIADIVIILLFIIVLISAAISSPDYYIYKPLSSTNYIDFTDSWMDLDGNPALLNNLNHLPTDSAGNIVITGRLPYYITSNQCLNFRSKNVDFDILINNQLIYTFHPKVGIFAGKSYGSCFHSVVLESDYSNSPVQLIIYPAYNDNSCFIDNMLIEPAGNYCWQFFVSHLFAFIICIFTILFGILGILFSIIFRKNDMSSPSVVYLSIMAINLGLWCMLETLTLQMLTGSLTVIHALNYLLLIIIPYPSIMFVNFSLSTPHKRYTRVALLTVTICATLCYILNFLGISDMHENLPIIHLSLIFSFIFIFYMIIRDYIRHKSLIKFSSMRVILIAFMSFTFCAIADLMRYWMSKSSVGDSALFMRVGLFLFIVLVTIDSFMRILSQFKMARQADMMREIASTDSLTGIPNRFAYNTIEDELIHRIEDREINSVLVCSMDINNLKLINDIYGHAFGDKHIMAAAAIISDAFAGVGQCFRTGGDEFILLITCDEPEIVFEERIAAMHKAENEYNSMTDIKIPLVIAYGYAIYSPTCNCSMEQITQQADRNMYKCKRDFKHKK